MAKKDKKHSVMTLEAFRKELSNCLKNEQIITLKNKIADQIDESEPDKNLDLILNELNSIDKKQSFDNNFTIMTHAFGLYSFFPQD